MTFKEFEDNVFSDIVPNREELIRPGQAIMNYLSKVWMEEYNRISSVHFYDNVDIDCFYNDRLIPKTLKHLGKVWINYPN